MGIMKGTWGHICRSWQLVVYLRQGEEATHRVIIIILYLLIIICTRLLWQTASRLGSQA